MKNIMLIFLFVICSCSKQVYNETKLVIRDKKITGKVTVNTQPAPGVTITIKGTKIISQTDFDGNYMILVNEKDKLLFSYVGCKSHAVDLIDKDTINVAFEEDAKSIERHTIIVKKPVLYLYPKEKKDVSIRLHFKGKIETTYPKYDSSWEVTAYPDGSIFEKKTKRFYNSLFWDGSYEFPITHYDYKEGFVVLKSDLPSFLIEKLEFVGLNNTETNEFLQFWLPIMEKNEINFVHFWINDDYDNSSKNVILPKPDTEIRIFMEFYSLENMIKITEQQLPRIERKGFTLVEWGGTDVNGIINMSKL